MSQLISIVIPVYNHFDKLGKTLESIFNQTYKDLEVIVVDDGSDKEFQISDFPACRQAGRIKNSDLVKLIRQENKGAPVARNRGMDEAKGDYVIFWDADLIARSDMLEKMKRALDENPEASYSYCNYKFGFKKMPAREFDPDALKKVNYIITTSLIRKKDAIRWDESLKKFQDWDLWLTMFEQGKKGVWLNEYLFDVQTGGTMSTWLPSFAYKVPFKWLPFVRGKVKKYEEAYKIIKNKHRL